LIQNQLFKLAVKKLRRVGRSGWQTTFWQGLGHEKVQRKTSEWEGDTVSTVRNEAGMLCDAGVPRRHKHLSPCDL